jgi:hypothetical protein
MPRRSLGKNCVSAGYNARISSLVAHNHTTHRGSGVFTTRLLSTPKPGVSYPFSHNKFRRSMPVINPFIPTFHTAYKNNNKIYNLISLLIGGAA